MSCVRAQHRPRRAAPDRTGQGRRLDERLVARAARNNAQWCDAVCRLHGITGTFSDDAWTSAVRTPTHYPDAVTLRRSVDPAGVLDRADASRGCSVKDSFAELDLGPWGFEVLFEAPWIQCTAESDRGAAGAQPWSQVRDDQTLAAWEAARAVEGEGHRAFPPGLLAHPDVLVLGASHGEEIVAGAVVYVGAGVAGLGSLFTTGPAPSDAFAGAAAAVARLHPGLALVGYETGVLLDAAEEAGFERIGRLAVWIRT